MGDVISVLYDEIKQLRKQMRYTVYRLNKNGKPYCIFQNIDDPNSVNIV